MIEIKDAKTIKILSEFEEALLRKTLVSSDDYVLHQKIFFKAASELIRHKVMTIGDFEEFGGWVRSSVIRNTYFTYGKNSLCVSTKIMLNVKTKQLISSLAEGAHQL